MLWIFGEHSRISRLFFEIGGLCSGDWCAVRGTFVWTFNGPPAGLPVTLPPPLVKRPTQSWHQENLGDSLSIYHSTFSYPLLSLPFFSKDNFGEYFIGYIASVSLVEWGEWHAMTTDGATRWCPLGDSLFFLVCLPDTPTPPPPPVFLLSQTAVLSGKSLAADHLAVSLKFSMTAELLPIHLMLLKCQHMDANLFLHRL